jgi:hypothetical protein
MAYQNSKNEPRKTSPRRKNAGRNVSAVNKSVQEEHSEKYQNRKK